jgi:hypothetical protein
LRLDPGLLTHLRELLVPGGLFVALEVEPNALWDLVFGQNASWWQTAPWARHASSLRSTNDWRSELAVAGFESTGVTAVTAAPWPNGVFWGCAPALSETAIGDLAEPEPIMLVSGDTAFRAALQE